MLEKFKKLKREKGLNPRHIAIATDGKIDWAKLNKKTIDQSYKRTFIAIRKTIQLQVKLKIPIVTFHIFSKYVSDLEYFSTIIDNMIDFLDELSVSKLIHENMVKVSVLGKWYDLPGRIVDPVKNILEQTRDYDNFFVNFCVNYGGREEIVDAVRLIARQIKVDKITPEEISGETIKDNVYSSSFLSPDLIIKNGKKVLPDFLLWDCVGAKVYFTGKLFPDFDKGDFEKGIDYYKKAL